MSEKPTSLVGCGVGGGTREGTLYPILDICNDVSTFEFT